MKLFGRSEGQNLSLRSKDTQMLSGTMGRGFGLPSVHFCNADKEDNYPNWTFDYADPLQKHREVRSWLQTFEAMGSENCCLVDPYVRTIQMSLGWDSETRTVDASVFLFDAHQTPVDFVWYKQLRSQCGSVAHSGQTLTGTVHDGDKKAVSVTLSEIPPHVHHLLFVATVSCLGLSFCNIQSAYARMMSIKKRGIHDEMFRLSLTGTSSHSMLVGVMTRKGALWNVRSLGTGATEKNIKELVQKRVNLRWLSACPSLKPEFRHITVTVIKATGLAAKDSPGILRRTASSDPYFLMTFKDKRFKSRYLPQTLEPEWSSSPFEMEWITETETKPLKIELFDYDMIGADDFMGRIKIPAHALYDLGPGEHTYWIILGHSKKCKNEDVSGSALVRIVVTQGERAHGYYPNGI